jgi:isoleucyl-tRNA synthetase
MADDADQVTDIIYELLQDPIITAGAILALLHTCKAMVELCADATPHTADEVWSNFAATVAWVAINEQEQEQP